MAYSEGMTINTSDFERGLARLMTKAPAAMIKSLQRAGIQFMTQIEAGFFCREKHLNNVMKKREGYINILILGNKVPRILPP